MTAGRAVAWHRGRVVAATPETPDARRLVLDVPTWPGNDAGAHVDVRLTAADGYQASRSYSLASSGEEPRVALAVEELPDGEVSPYLVRGVEIGDELEILGPLGRFFVWRPSAPGSAADPVQLIAGGSGVVPLYAMAAAHERADDPSEFRLLYAVRSPREVFFADELAALARTTVDFVYSREAPVGASRAAGRIDRAELERLALAPDLGPRIYVCGPNAFVEAVAGWLVELGHAPTSIRTERFGGT